MEKKELLIILEDCKELAVKAGIEIMKIYNNMDDFAIQIVVRIYN